MAGIDGSCWLSCVSLGKHQRDANGCRVRPDEGLDAIASLAPGSISSEFLVGGTNTVYAWLIQWLAENLGMCCTVRGHIYIRKCRYIYLFYHLFVTSPDSYLRL